ncbi:hypothetical protein ElyMa_006698700 [Elysia marginata]|uniref:Uncharacterized protein n=1 Tax=Elysia marginata TaxID=1093978 RepID=A0AAV4IUS7_9GAST|nr:hypothetical protein ElyMa_006698700 [Elysia marginata]
MRMPTDQTAHRAYNYRYSGKRLRGRPRRRWSDSVADTLKGHNKSLCEASHLAVERRLHLPATPDGKCKGTEKLVNKEAKRIECSVKPSFLQNLVVEKKCQLYIISAIRPSRMNMDTLLMEVDRLGIRKYFCPFWQSQHQQNPKSVTDESNQDLGGLESCVELVQGNLDAYVRWGNIIICGYDKAEVFLEILSAEETRGMRALNKNMTVDTDWTGIKASEDMVDGLAEDDDTLDEKAKSASNMPEINKARPVIFFDDEEVNILNFSKIVKNSICIWIH